MTNQNLYRFSFFTLAFGLLLTPVFSNNGGNDNASADENLANEQRLEQLQQKADLIVLELQDLKEAKKIATTSSERKAIRYRAKELKGELNAVYAEGKKISGGVYIGSTALIVILLLLLLL